MEKGICDGSTSFVRYLEDLIAAIPPQDDINVPPLSEETVTIADVGRTFILIGAILDNTVEDPDLLVFSATIKLIAGFLFVKTAFREAKEQLTSNNETTLANKWKIWGSIISTVGAVILYLALLRETGSGRLTDETADLQIFPFYGGTGAF